MNKFIRNLKILYEVEQLSPTLIKRIANLDLRFGDITKNEYENFILWIDEQENSKNEKDNKIGIGE